MASKSLLLFITVLIAMLSASRVATAATITYVWMGAEVTITHPDAVIYGQAFDISFSIDTATAEPSITLAFMTFLDMSDTLTATNSP